MTVKELDKALKYLKKKAEEQREKYDLEYDGNFVAGIDDGSYPI